MTAINKARPYKPSGIDRLNTWGGNLPVGVWIFYVAFGIVLILVQIVFLSFEGGLHAEELLPVIIFNGLAPPFLMALIYLLDNQAIAALNAMRPILDTTAQEFDDYEYRLSNMPFLAPLNAGLALTVLVILTPVVTAAPVRYAALDQLPVFTVVYHIIDKSSAFLFGTLLYHSIRQLRLVNSSNDDHVRVNLYHLRPLQAFSRLTASTALGLVVFVYPWMLINPELLTDPVIIGYTLVFTIVAALVFVWPLWGTHKLLEMEKERALHEINLSFEAVFAKFNQRMHDGDYAAAERLNGVIASLDIQYRKISSIATWPWRPETARIALTAIALPLILMILQTFVLQALSR